MVVLYHHDPQKNRWVVVAKQPHVPTPTRVYTDTREDAILVRDALYVAWNAAPPLVSSVEGDTFCVWATGFDAPLVTFDMQTARALDLDPNLVARGIQDYLLDILVQPVYDDAS